MPLCARSSTLAIAVGDDRCGRAAAARRPGTSKWNKIEHRLFCHISQNWRGRPLISYQVIINSIAATTTSAGLTVFARLDERDYPKKVEVSDRDLAAVNLTADPFHPEWNYTISPTPNSAG